VRSKELKSYNLDKSKTIIKEIGAKPYTLLLLIIATGIVISFVGIPIVYGITLIVIGLIILLLFPNRVLIDFYDNHLVLFNRAAKDDCVIIYYDEIVSWWYTRDIGVDELRIELEDGTIEKINAFSKFEFEKNMNGFVKDKYRKNVK